MEMCGAVTTKLKTSSASRDASTSGVKEASVAACRSAGDSIVVVVEHLGRDMPSCLNYLALRSIVRAMRDASDVVASGLKILSAEGKAARWIGGDYCRALEHFNKVMYCAGKCVYVLICIDTYEHAQLRLMRTRAHTNTCIRFAHTQTGLTYVYAYFCLCVLLQVHAHLPQALSDLANRVEDSRPLTEQLDVVKVLS